MCMVSKKVSQTHKKVTVAFGYSLFALTVAAVVLSTVVPYVSMLLNPLVRHLNVVLILVTFVSAAILPPLLSYLIGDRSTHNKNKTLHHYNGILFAVSAYWLITLFSFYASGVISGIWASITWDYNLVLVNALPIIATLVILAVVATIYSRHQKAGSSVITSAAYQVVLIGGFAALLVSSIVQLFSTESAYIVWALLTVLIPLVLATVSYAAIRDQPSRRSRLTAAVVAVTMGYVAVSVASQLSSYISFNTLIPIVIGIVVWATYLRLSTR